MTSAALDFHRAALADHPDEPIRAQGWRTSESQTKRFEALLGVGNLHGQAVLDLGCGRGDFFEWLERRSIQPRAYLGYDLLPEFIEQAQNRYAGHRPRPRFLVRDFMSTGLWEAYGAVDYAAYSGSLNYRTDNPDAYQIPVEQAFRAVRKGLAFNLLDARTFPADDPYLQPHDPADVRAWARTLSPKSTLRDDYLDDDFTVFLWK